MPQSPRCLSYPALLLLPLHNAKRLYDRPESSDTIFIDDSNRIQILPTMASLPRADKEQRGAFIVCVIRVEQLLATNWAYIEGRTCAGHLGVPAR